MIKCKTLGSETTVGFVRKESGKQGRRSKRCSGDDRLRAPYAVAAKANLYTAGLSYTLPVDMGPISSLKFYNDFGWMDKRIKRFKDSFQNVAGCMITAGGVYAYVDYAWEKIMLG
jgi:hypothetical protein